MTRSKFSRPAPLSSRRVASSARHTDRRRSHDRVEFEVRDIINDDGEAIAVFLPHRS